MLPIRLADDSERFPVVYATDGDDYFDGLAALATQLQLHGEVPRFVLVGIGYENSGAAALLRMRDFHLHSVRKLYARELDDVARSPLAPEQSNLAAIFGQTDASDFLEFIRRELVPLVESRFPTRPGDTTYFGYSAGGGFGLFTLFTKPDTFARYIIGSPATSYDGHHFAIQLAREFISSGREIDARLFLSVGELEEFKRGFEKFELVTGYYQLAKYLTRSNQRGLVMTTRVLPNETHATAWASAFASGLRALFEAGVQVPFCPDYMK